MTIATKKIEIPKIESFDKTAKISKSAKLLNMFKMKKNGHTPVKEEKSYEKKGTLLEFGRKMKRGVVIAALIGSFGATTLEGFDMSSLGGDKYTIVQKHEGIPMKVDSIEKGTENLYLTIGTGSSTKQPFSDFLKNIEPNDKIKTPVFSKDAVAVQIFKKVVLIDPAKSGILVIRDEVAELKIEGKSSSDNVFSPYIEIIPTSKKPKDGEQHKPGKVIGDWTAKFVTKKIPDENGSKDWVMIGDETLFVVTEKGGNGKRGVDGIIAELKTIGIKIENASKQFEILDYVDHEGKDVVYLLRVRDADGKIIRKDGKDLAYGLSLTYKEEGKEPGATWQWELDEDTSKK